MTVSENRSLDGVLDKLNTKDYKEFEEDAKEEDFDSSDDELANMHEAKKRNMKVKRREKRAIRVKAVKFSPDGKLFACSTTEGVMFYSTELKESFWNVRDLDMDCTLENLVDELKSENYLNALVMALRFNNAKILSNTFSIIPDTEIIPISSTFPIRYLSGFITFLSKSLTETQHS